jgi:MFS family permease
MAKMDGDRHRLRLANGDRHRLRLANGARHGHRSGSGADPEVPRTFRLRRPRVAATAIFFVTGLASATWAARIPAVKDRLGLTESGLAVAVLAIEAGALVGLPLGAALATRIGSRRSLALAFCVFPPALPAAVTAPSLAVLAGCLALWACANSVVDVAMNVQGVELERRRGRPLLAGLHGAHSLGLLGGGLAAVMAAAAGAGLAVHAGTVAALASAGALLASRGLVHEPRAQHRVLARPDRALLPIGLVAFAAAMADGAAINWSAVHLRVVHHAAPAVAAAGFTVFALALSFVRMGGDRLTARLGRVRVVQAGGGVAAAGAALAIAAPNAPLALAGWALVGAGLASVMPAAIGAAPAATRAPAGVAIASVSTIGYLGSFTGPPLIGFIAGFAGLSAGLALLIAAAALSALLAGRAL